MTLRREGPGHGGSGPPPPLDGAKPRPVSPANQSAQPTNPANQAVRSRRLQPARSDLRRAIQTAVPVVSPTPAPPNDTLRTLRFRAWAALCRSRKSAKARSDAQIGSGRPSGGRLWHGCAVRRPPVWRAGRAPRGGRDRCIRRSSWTVGAEECATTGTTSSGCSRRRTWPGPAGCRAAPSTERLREASCERPGYATGCGSIRRSWSAGSPRKQTPPIRRHRRDPGGAPGSCPADCERCSMRRGRGRDGRR
jgi:hypothetical protein